MKILVTGGAGFIGSAFVRRALECGHCVVNIDSLSYAGNSANLEIVAANPNYFFEHLDIRDFKNLKRVFKKHLPEAVVHLAAESHVDRSIDGPADFISTNIIGTFYMLEVTREYYVKTGLQPHFKFLHVSTDEVFGSLPYDRCIKFTEETPYDPRSPYSASKASSDHLVRAWFHTYGVPTVLTNCSNNYGPYQFPEKLIPIVIINALNGKDIPIYGDGSNVRDWLYVEDHADAMLLVLEKGVIGRSYNIGGENELTNLELVQKICAVLDRIQPKQSGCYSDQIVYVNDRPGHDARYAIDPARIRNEMEWRPSVRIDEGIERTVRWYIEHPGWWEPLTHREGVGKRLGTQV